MIIVNLKGGMGNQMFQYAFAKSLAIKYNTTFKLDTHFLLDHNWNKGTKHFVYRDYDLSIFNIEENFATIAEVNKFKKRVGIEIVDRAINKLIGKKKTYSFESSLMYDENLLKNIPNSYYDGYFQSPKYFSSINEIIKSDFTLKGQLQERSKHLIQEIENKNAVCVNIRRGDFVYNSYHGTCDESYYAAAEKIIVSKISNPQFYVFSDEIQWCKENLHFSVPTTFVDHEYAGVKFQDYLMLMRACKHFIIPNSSFAWWAAYLSAHQDKIVITPKRWMAEPNFTTKDLILDNWLSI